MTRTKFGEIIEGRHRYITWRKQQHFMKKYQGFGISITELRRLYDANVKEVVLKYETSRGTNKLYKTQLWDWLMSKKEYDDEGDLQRFISVTDMYYVGEDVS